MKREGPVVLALKETVAFLVINDRDDFEDRKYFVISRRVSKAEAFKEAQAEFDRRTK